MNIESGPSYQAQERSGSPDVQNYFFHVWPKMSRGSSTPRMTLVEIASCVPRLENPSEYRGRLEATKRFALLQDLNLNQSMINR